jgi:flagellin-like hook-associated protein FlgL
MSDITLSAGIRANLLSLQQTSDLMTLTQNRLATGKKVNSALDNPLNYFQSSSLSARANDLSGLLDQMASGISTIQAANNGITAITSLVQQLKATVQQARSDGTQAAVSAGTGTDFSLAATPATTGNLTFHVGGSTVAIAVGDGAATPTALTVDQLVSSINGNSALNSFVKASNVSGKLHLQDLTTTAIQVDGADGSQNITGTGTTTNALAAGTAGTISTVRQSLMNQFNDLLTQIDKAAGDAGYNGINLLAGDDLKLNFNENGTSNIHIQSKDANGNKFVLTAGNLGFSNGTTNQFADNTALDSLSNTVATALTTLRTQATSLGSQLSVVQTRQDFTKSMVNTLQTGADNLVLADTNEEGANLLALQTRQSLSTTALSLSAQADQNVLRLFG